MCAIIVRYRGLVPKSYTASKDFRSRVVETAIKYFTDGVTKLESDSFSFDHSLAGENETLSADMVVTVHLPASIILFAQAQTDSFSREVAEMLPNYFWSSDRLGFSNGQQHFVSIRTSIVSVAGSGIAVCDALQAKPRSA